MYKTCLFFTGLTAIAVAVVLLAEWGYGTLPWQRGKQEAHFPTQATTLRQKRSSRTVAKEMSENRCADNKTIFLTYRNNHPGGIQVCIPTNRSVTITIPFGTLINGGISGDSYGQGHTWYMTNNLQWAGWETLVAETGGYDWSAWSTTDWSRHQRKLIKLVTGQTGLVLTVDLTKGNLDPTGRDKCWGFLLRAKTSGTDPSFKLILCEGREGTDVTTSPHNPKGVQTALIGSKKGVKVYDTFEISTGETFTIYTGITSDTNNWLVMTQQAAKTVKEDCVVCLGPRPLLRVVPLQGVSGSCILELTTNTSVSKNCTPHEEPFKVIKKEVTRPWWDKNVASGNFSCFQRNTKTKASAGEINSTLCKTTTATKEDIRVRRSDLWWWCGGDVLYQALGANWTGTCAPVTLILPVRVIPTKGKIGPIHRKLLGISKRAVVDLGEDPTYIDAIGVPRGVPDEYKLVDQIAAGWESFLCPWCTINKNVDRINYVHYNIQRLGNVTEKGLLAVHEQLKATSLISFQNRIALDMLLAEKGGVCSMFGELCCTFIPNNTAEGGKLTKALEGLRALNDKMKEHSGVNNPLEGLMERWFGRWKSYAMAILTSLTTVCGLLLLCGCCILPCSKALCIRLITGVVEQNVQLREKQLLLKGGDEEGEGPVKGWEDECV